MRRTSSLGQDYFEGIFARDDDPWELASSDYERAKFERSIAAINDRRHASGLEVGCAQGVLTQRLLPLCDRLLAIDISAIALKRARLALGPQPGLMFAQMAFPRQSPDGRFDLCVLSEVAYYWDRADLMAAGRWLCEHMEEGARVLLVHYTGDTDYPATADEALGTLEHATHELFASRLAERHQQYRLDLWERT